MEFNWIFKSGKEQVYMLSVNKNSSGTYVKGFVESESRKGMYHYAVAFISPRKDIVGGGFCECESRHYYGKPCKHVLSLRNMYEKHRDELDRLAAPYPEIRR
ncbi:MAG: SWIM zinc finger family protein [Candidatus Micrarchaeia archaeon]